MSTTDAAELLTAIREFLRSDVVPQLDGFTAYNTRVAVNSLGIVARELELGAQLRDIDSQAAVELGIDPDAGAVAQQIAIRLRDGDMAVTFALLSYLRRRTLKTLAIDNPKYSGYLQARNRWAAGNPQESDSE